MIDPAIIDTLTGEAAKLAYTFVLGVGAQYAFHKVKNRNNFNKAASGNRVSPEVKISLLQWEEAQENGQTVYNLHSSTKGMDLRKILPDEYKDELPRLIMAAAREATEDSPFIVDHIDTAAKKYAGTFKSKKGRQDFADKIQSFIDEETRYIIQDQWGGGSVLQQAYEATAKSMEGFYGVWLHQSSDDVQEIRLLLLPEKYLHEPIPDPALMRVREGEKGGNGFYHDAEGNHSHIQRMKILQKAVDKLKSDSSLRGKSWISLPVNRPEQQPAQEGKMSPLALDQAVSAPSMQ